MAKKAKRRKKAGNRRRKKQTGARITAANATNEIVRRLERIAQRGHYPRHDLFLDFMRMASAVLDMLPQHLRSVRTDGNLADDPADVKNLWARFRERYPRAKTWIWEALSEAVGILLYVTTDQYRDTLGEVYQQLNMSKKGWGQIFTPWDTALLIAQTSIPDGMHEIISRLAAAGKKAADKDPLVGIYIQSLLLTTGAMREGEKEGRRALPDDYFIEKIMPILIPYYEPLTIMDPACGSGTLLLAAATRFPPEFVELGFVQFYGQDIDPVAVEMARLNIKLYGLNGSYIDGLMALADIDVSEAQKPFTVLRQYQDGYTQAVIGQVGPTDSSMAWGIKCGNSLTNPMTTTEWHDIYQAVLEAREAGDRQAEAAAVADLDAMRRERVLNINLFDYQRDQAATVAA